MLYERNQLEELHYMKHRHDTDSDYVKYDEQLLDKTTSPYLFNNDMMFGFMKRIQPLVSLFFDNMNLMKNLKNYIVSKYHYKHLG